MPRQQYAMAVQLMEMLETVQLKEIVMMVNFVTLMVHAKMDLQQVQVSPLKAQLQLKRKLIQLTLIIHQELHL